jgi:SAM-dependent methyltransferase
MSQHLGPTTDYTPVAARYDATRHIPAEHLAAAYRRLVAAGLLAPAGVVIDAGCGTGQVGLPLVTPSLAAGRRTLRGYDVSHAMVALARAKLRPGMDAAYAVADARALPEREGAADAVVVSKLLQHVGDWQRAVLELLRVLRPGGVLVHFRDRGFFGNPVRRHITTLADAAGFRTRFRGLADMDALAPFLAGLGCEPVPFDTADLTWEATSTYAEVLANLREGLHAEFWSIPPADFARLLDATAQWVAAQPQGAATPIRMTPHLVTDVFRKP